MNPERKAQLDAMTEDDKRLDILANIKEHGAVRLCSGQAVAFWGGAVDALVDEGLVKVEHKENYEGQYSWIEVTAA